MNCAALIRRLTLVLFRMGLACWICSCHATAAPTLAWLNPPVTWQGGPSFTLYVSGNGFVSGSQVQWNGANLATTFVNSAQLEAQVDASQIATPGTAIVKVLNPDSTLSNSVTFTITKLPAPVLTAIEGPLPVVGGPAFNVTVDGTGFLDGAVVQWSGQPLSTTFISNNQLSATVPASAIAALGTFAVTVVNPGGGVSNTLPLEVIVEVDSISPASVPAGSGDFNLTVTGIGFPPNSVVEWNSIPLATTFINSTQLTVRVPGPQVTAPAVVILTISYPGAGVTIGDIFRVLAPVLSALSPSMALGAGPTFTLTATGSGFVSSSLIEWNGQALPTTWVSGTELTGLVPATAIATPGKATVCIQNSAYTDSNSLTFTITASAGSTSTVDGLAPASVAAGGGPITLTVGGGGFVSGSLVQWNGSNLTTTFISTTQLTAVVAASLTATAGTATVTVWSPGGNVSSALPFTVTGRTPSTTSISPASATAGGTTFILTVSGSGFVDGSTVQWNGLGLATNYVSANQLTASVPASLIANAGSAGVTILNPGGTTSNSVPFTINVPLLSISGLSPTAATAGGATFTLSVYGSGFVNGSTVQWNGSPLATIYVGANQLNASVAASLIANPGSAGVTVLNPGLTVSPSLTFDIHAPTPSVSSLVPNSTTAGGPAFALTVNGLGFLSGSTVQWNGAALATTYIGANLLTASVPAGLIASAGSASIEVVNPSNVFSNGLTFTIVSSSALGLSVATASPLPAGTVGLPYSQTLSATGGTAPYTNWAVVDPLDLPTGILLASSGTAAGPLLTGTPTAPGIFTFTVQVTDSANSIATAVLSLTIAANSVSIMQNGVRNAASYAYGSVAPGEIVTIFGSSLGPDTLHTSQLDSNGRVSTSLMDTQVLFDGVPAPILYTLAGQVSAIVPYEVAGKGTTQVQVFYQGKGSNVVATPVSAVMPGIFTLDASGHGAGAILNQDGTVNSPGNPASVGTYVVIYATGEGQTVPAGEDGQPDASPAPVPIAEPVSATIGGVAIPAVQYAGGAPGLVAGVLQINIQIPQGVPTGGSVPIAITVGGQDSQTGVTLAIK